MIGEKLGSEKLSAEQYAATLTDEQINDDDFDVERLDKKADDFGVNEDDYSIIGEQDIALEIKDSNGQYIHRKMNIDEVASTMVGLTQKLIYEIDNEKYPDEIVYLDKSGRPVSWFVNKFWNVFASRDENGNVRKRPHHSYINIDRGLILKNFFGMEIYSQDQCKDEYGNYMYFGEAWKEKKRKLRPEHFAQLRALYVDGGLDPDSDPKPREIMAMPSVMDGKKILIVDEVASRQGTTLDIAKTLFEGAFPGCEVRTEKFWDQLADMSVPMWYNNQSVWGRGTGDVFPPHYEDALSKMKEGEYIGPGGMLKSIPERAITDERHEQNLRQAKAREYGRFLLSEPVDLSGEPGDRTRRLTSDIDQLYRDYLANKIVPAYKHDDERYYINLVRHGVNPGKRADIAKEVFSRNNPDFGK